MSRRIATLYWAWPAVFCLLLFHRGLQSWFQQDDFSLLQVEINGFRDLWRLLVEPHAQGTIRPFSEHYLFFAFRKLFGLYAFPYHLLTFATQFLNLALLAVIVRKISGSRWAGAVASLVWGVNAALVAPMLWMASYSQILCASCYLAGFYLFLRHVETGQRSFYRWQCGVFLFGFGVLETIVAYPAVVFCYCVLLARKHVWKAVALGVPSALYTAVHLWIIPRAAAGPYAIHVDADVIRGLGTYWSWTLASNYIPETPRIALIVLLSAGLAAGLYYSRRPVLFGLAWFLVTLAPVLPLRGHRLDYYLAVPAIGIAVAAGAMSIRLPRLAAAAWLGLYVAGSAVAVHSGTEALYTKTWDAFRFLEGVRQIRGLHPDKTIVLTGVSDSLYYAVVYDGGLRMAGLTNVYLAPTSDEVRGRPGLASPDRHRLPARATLRALQQDTAVVYQLAGRQFQNITNRYRYVDAAALPAGPPRRVDAGTPEMAGELGSGWYAIQQDHRWMGRRAELRLAGPRSAEEKLHIQCYYSLQGNPGTIVLSITANGIAAGRIEVRDNDSCDRVLPLPPQLVGREEMQLTLEADHTFQAPGDNREISLAFGVVELTP